MRKILITGGSGFVGGHLISLARDMYKVHATYYQHYFEHQNIIAHRFDLGNVSQITPFLEKIKPDVIIHTAALSNPDYCEQHQKTAMVINVDATRALIHWAKENHARFIFTSSDMVFNGKEGGYRETDPPDPISFYARTKVMSEDLIINSEANYVVARIALVYGIGITRHTCFFEKMINDLAGRKSVTLFYDQIRSPILVNILARALLELAGNDFTGIIHLGGDERISRWDFGVKACKVLNLPLQYLIKKSMDEFATVAFRPRDISLVCDLAKRVLKTKLLDCDEGLEQVKSMFKVLS